jgi:glycosyltransferase 2 family protein
MAEHNSPNFDPSPKKSIWTWLSLLLTAVLLIIGLWYVMQRVTLTELEAALSSAQPLYILLSLLTVVLTLLVKSWRWQALLTDPSSKPAFGPAFWSLNLGAYVNLILPFMRLGEVARLFAIDWTAHVGKARALGTIVVEKVVDLFMLALSLLLILPFIVLPGFMGNPLPMITAVSLAALLFLYLLAFQTGWIIRASRLFAGWLPAQWSERVMGWLIAGLEGLSALRQRRQTLAIIGLSLWALLLSILTPYFLFWAFNLPLRLVDAVLINLVVLLVSTPPSTPGKIGVVNGAAALLLISFGVSSDAVIFSYTTVYYLVVVAPIILFGGLAVSRTNWQWQKTSTP